MKCISCDVEINPKWKHAVEINVCPFCGQHILEEHLKNLLTSLADTMQKLQAYPDQLNDWLLSNYNYVKTDSPNLISYVPKEMIKELRHEIDEQDFQDRKKFTVKVKTEKGEEEVEAQTLQSEDKTNAFFKRAEVIKPQAKDPKEGFKSPTEKTAYIKNLKKQIEEEGSQGVISEDGLAAMISPDMIESADPEAVAAVQAMISAGSIASSLPGAGTGEDDDIPAAVLAMASRAKQRGVDPSADLAKLQEMHARVNNSRQNFERGENRGKNGFSRS